MSRQPRSSPSRYEPKRALSAATVSVGALARTSLALADWRGDLNYEKFRLVLADDPRNPPIRYRARRRTKVHTKPARQHDHENCLEPNSASEAMVQDHAAKRDHLSKNVVSNRFRQKA